jgi:DNA-binding transcriptional MerR regulator
MKIGDLARRSGLSAHTLRYYERIGLLPFALRDRGGQRDYDASSLSWIEFLGRLKTTGMPVRERLRYAALRAAGDASQSERRRLLEAHREKVRADIVELQNCLNVLDSKIAGYAPASQRSQEDDASSKPASQRPLRARRESARAD